MPKVTNGITGGSKLIIGPQLGTQQAKEMTAGSKQMIGQWSQGSKGMNGGETSVCTNLPKGGKVIDNKSSPKAR